MDCLVPAIDLPEQNSRLAQTLQREQGRLRRFIRAHVSELVDVEDILQDVFCEFVEAVRLMTPIEHVSAWLFRVARNRITDLVRKRKSEVSLDSPVASRQGAVLFEDLLPCPAAGPEAAYARTVLVDELTAALDELPDDQRYVFVAHELEGRSFRNLADETGVRSTHCSRESTTPCSASDAVFRRSTTNGAMCEENRH